MSRLTTSFVLGYHGCDRAIAQKAVLQGAAILRSNRDYDWLGPGAYFWQQDPRRALEWAEWKVARGEYQHPAVIGAVIDLRHCLDLISRDDIEILRAAYRSFVKVQKKSGLPLPRNKNPRGTPNEDRSLRYLDCAVFRHLHQMVDNTHGVEPYDTVRGMFVEGGKAYPNSGLHRKAHVQIAVLNDLCIKGIFYPLELPPPG